jgi:ubiquinone biosynthesis protein
MRKKYPYRLHLLRIIGIIARYRLDVFLPADNKYRPLKLLLRAHPAYWRHRPIQSDAIRLRLALEALGPIFIKFGQILATRRDFLSDAVAQELNKLLDQVPPFDGKIAIQMIEDAYGKPLSDLFAHFEITPLASASVAQVHGAQLPDGTPVVVKVLRPDIKKHVQRDIALMYQLAHLMERFGKLRFRLQPHDLVAEFEHSLLDELDLRQEAANAAQLKRNFDGSPLLYVPTVYWDYLHHQVMVMERIEGINIANIEALKAQGSDLKQLAENAIAIFFTQLLRDSFFHADMHPGNIFVSTKQPEHPQYIVVDFGIMGSLSPDDQRYLAEHLLAFFNRDYRQVALLHIESGWIPADTRVEHFESTMRGVCEPLFAKPLKDISFGQLLLRLIQTAQRFNMHIQPQLLLLQKTLLNVEGLSRTLDPELDLWQTAKPCIEDWLKTQIGVSGVFKKIRAQFPFWMEKLPEMPDVIYKALTQTPTPPPTPPIPVAPKTSKPYLAFLLGASLMLSAALLAHFLI